MSVEPYDTLGQAKPGLQAHLAVPAPDSNGLCGAQTESNPVPVMMCPLYQTTNRLCNVAEDELVHSSLLMRVPLPVEPKHEGTHWLLRGVALLCDEGESVRTAH